MIDFAKCVSSKLLWDALNAAVHTQKEHNILNGSFSSFYVKFQFLAVFFFFFPRNLNTTK